MLAFTVTDSGVQSGIVVRTDAPSAGEPAYAAVWLGEAGRGRRLTRVPLGRNFAAHVVPTNDAPRLRAEFEAAKAAWSADHVDSWLDDSGLRELFREVEAAERAVAEGFRLEAASLLVTSQGTTLLVEPRAGETDALVAVRVSAGYRGFLHVGAGLAPCSHGVGTPLEVPTLADGRQGYPKRCKECGADPVWASDGAHRVTLLPLPAGRIVAQGICAQGHAGRMGNHDELLVRLAPGEELVAIRQGRTYGDPPIKRIAWDGRMMSYLSAADRAGMLRETELSEILS